MVTFSEEIIHRKYIRNIGKTEWITGCAKRKYGQIDEKILGRIYKNHKKKLESVDINNKGILW